MTPAEALARFAGRIVFVGGGPPIWSAYAPCIRHWDITRLPYDGEADHWFGPAWIIRNLR
jgi:dihydromethanopterin reductase